MLDQKMNNFFKKNKLIYIVIVLMLILSACGGNATPAATTSTEKMVEYVGEIAGTEFFVAIAVGSTGDALAYVCDGKGTDYLFHGTVQANAVNLTSDVGEASLQANLESAGFAGAFSAGGQTYSFTTSPVQDYGGLYRVVGLTEFEAEGTSQGGAALKMNLSPDKELIKVAVITATGDTLSYENPTPLAVRETTEYKESWVIFLNSGHAHGGDIKKSLVTGSTNIIRTIDPLSR